MRLFDIHSAIEQILATRVDQETGEIGEEALAALEELELAKNEKILAIAAYLKGERAEGDAVKDQANKLTARAKQHHARADRLEAYIAEHLTPGQNLSDSRSALSWRRSESIEITDESLIPIDYIRTKIEIDKAGIKRAMKDGIEIPGSKIKVKMNLQIK
jgi:hypothetical protein